ncbi:MAG: glycosyltransferase [Candidatus Hodarchaeota archaeon]
MESLTAILTPLVSVVCCAHNEEEYVERTLPPLLKALKSIPSYEIIFVADRCTDNTVDIVKRYTELQIIQKTWKNWKNSYAESLQAGFRIAKAVYFCIIDADIAVPENFFRDLLPMIQGDIASASAEVVVYPNSFWNRMIHAWEKTRNIAPLGKEPWGAARIVLRSALEDIDGFRDMPTPDTDIDIRLAKIGFKNITSPTVKVYHLRQLSPRRMMSGQIVSGRGRYACNVGLIRTIGHALFRFRPFVIGGWLIEWVNNNKS